jgi:malonate-semialdehyde dehydrogenase (acetylating)/methylmalonate-semialdehyde dehydrogenase
VRRRSEEQPVHDAEHRGIRPDAQPEQASEQAAAAHRDRVATYLEVAKSEGAEIALDGRAFDLPHEGFLLGPSVVDRVRPTMRLAREEIFGPVLSVVRAGDLDEALALGRQCEYGNGASIFTSSGWAARGIASSTPSGRSCAAPAAARTGRSRWSAGTRCSTASAPG